MSKKNKLRPVRQPTGPIHYKNNGPQNISSQAGIIPVVKFLEKLGFWGLFIQHVHLKRPQGVLYRLSDVVFLMLIGYAAGGTNITQCLVVWGDSVLRRAAGWIRIPDDSTVGRIFKEVKERHINELESFIHAMRERVWTRAIRAGRLCVVNQCIRWIDVDSSVITVYGHQEGAAKGYNPHKRGAPSFHPLLAFLPQTKEILQAWFRTGSAYTSNGIVEFMKQLLSFMPAHRLIFRGDSGFFVGALMDLLDLHGHGYLIKVKLKGLAKLLLKQHWTPVPGQPGWEQCEFRYQASGWKAARSFVAVRRRIETADDDTAQEELFEPAPNYEFFCYVSTEAMSPWLTHKTYGQRATSETWIEEAKSQMGLGHVRTHEFLANAALFQTAVLAYNTLRWMALMSNNTQLQRWEPKTIRTFLIRVAGKLLTGGGQLTIRFSAGHFYQRIWDDWLALGAP